LDTFIHSTVITQLANKKFLDGIPADLKGKIMQHLKTAEKKHHDVVAEASKKDVEEIKQKGGNMLIGQNLGHDHGGRIYGVAQAG
jgi:TRAP-type C4-dicarboxylate transport system substrate-binding protein